MRASPDQAKKRTNVDTHTEVDFLFLVLSRHQAPGIKAAVADGKEALFAQDTNRLRKAVHKIGVELRDFELHPALANQLKSATLAVELPAEPKSEPTQVAAPAVTVRTTGPSPSW